MIPLQYSFARLATDDQPSWSSTPSPGPRAGRTPPRTATPPARTRPPTAPRTTTHPRPGQPLPPPQRRAGLRMRGVRRVLTVHERDRLVDVEMVDHVIRALVEVDRAVVVLAVRARSVHGAQQHAAGLLDDPHRLTAAAAQIGE